MPAPLIPIVVGAVALLGGGGLLAKKFWKEGGGGRIFKGRQLLLIGLPASGKTTLGTFLATGKLPEKTQPTYGPNRHIDGKNASQYGISIDVIYDMRTHQGSTTDGVDYSAEREQVLNSDYILYLFDASEFKPNNEDKIKNEFKFYSQRVLKDNGGGKKFIAVGTHTDKLDVQPESTLMHTSIVNYLRSFDDVCGYGLVYGALDSEKNAVKLLETVSKEINNL